MTISLPVGMGVGIPGNKTWDANASHEYPWAHHAVRKLRPDWWYSWSDLYVFPEFEVYNANYFPMLYYCSPGFIDRHTSRITRMTDRLWLVGNEPERVDPRDERGNPLEHTSPAAFKQGMTYLREKYPAHRFAFPGCHWDDARWAYRGPNWLREYLQIGGPLPDVWHIHIYRFEPGEFREDLEEAVQTLRGYANLPVILSEYAAFPARLAGPIMDAAKAAIDAKLITAAAWFSAHYDDWTDPDLLDPRTGWLTLTGKLWASKPYTDTFPHKVFMPGLSR